MAKPAKSTKNFIYHIPILVTRILQYIHDFIEDDRPIDWILDATLGDGGHSLSFLGLYPDCKLIALDRDEQMLDRAQKRLTDLGYRVCKNPAPGQMINSSEFQVFLFHANYDKAHAILEQHSLKAQIILIDAGVSMFHFQKAGRGFSYNDENLDMRLDFHNDKSRVQNDLTAHHIVNHSSKKELLEILKKYGEQKFARRIVDSIVSHRPISDARNLASLVLKAVPKVRSSAHPAATVFQALRIHVNQELESLDRAVRNLPASLCDGGLFFVISFHSLEDRIVKLAFRDLGDKIKLTKKIKKYNDRSVQDSKAYEILTPVPQQVGQFELEWNPASRSARMRILKKKNQNPSGE